MIKNYIFDFGNVLAEFYPEKLTAPFVTDEEILKTVSSVVFDRFFWDKLDSGDITDDEVKSGIAKRLPPNLTEIACKVYDNWVNNLTPVKGMQKLVLDIKKSGKRLYLLSNISVGFAQTYANVKWINDILSCFDGIVLSAQVGLTKPHKDIFEYLLATYKLNAEECIFIDDSAVNVDSAIKTGIKGYLFDGNVDKLRENLCV